MASSAAGEQEAPVLPLAVPWAHALLVVWSLAPLAVAVNTNVNVIFTAVLTVFIGCRRSVKPTPPADSMSRQDAMRFPLIGSAVLFSLFLVFKFLPKDLVNMVLSTYFVVLGSAALTATVAPLLEPALSPALRDRTLRLFSLRVPYVMKETMVVEVTPAEVAAGAASVAFCGWYVAQKHWVANNALGLAFSVQGIEHLSLGAVSTGVILLAGLFVYDVFWVFCTPVMVSVARSFEAPIKLLFLRAGDSGPSPFSMLGLGDIVIPGIFVALLLRYDYHQEYRTNYFSSAFGGYAAGLIATIVVMNVFKAAQPALLYIVPAVLAAVALHAWNRGEFSQVLHYSEAAEEGDSPDERPAGGSEGLDSAVGAAEKVAAAAKTAGGNGVSGVSEPKRRSARLNADNES